MLFGSPEGILTKVARILNCDPKKKVKEILKMTNTKLAFYPFLSQLMDLDQMYYTTRMTKHRFLWC